MRDVGEFARGMRGGSEGVTAESEWREVERIEDGRRVLESGFGF